MTEATNTKMMDTEPGGENTQYEGANTFTKPHAKSTGQFGDSNTTEADTKEQADKNARGEKAAENVRFGEAVSERGFAGQTGGNSGHAGGGAGQEKQGGTQMRREMGYGWGSGVGG